MNARDNLPRFHGTTVETTAIPPDDSDNAVWRTGDRQLWEQTMHGGQYGGSSFQLDASQCSSAFGAGIAESTKACCPSCPRPIIILPASAIANEGVCLQGNLYFIKYNESTIKFEFFLHLF